MNVYGKKSFFSLCVSFDERGNCNTRYSHCANVASVPGSVPEGSSVHVMDTTFLCHCGNFEGVYCGSSAQYRKEGLSFNTVQALSEHNQNEKSKKLENNYELYCQNCVSKGKLQSMKAAVLFL